MCEHGDYTASGAHHLEGNEPVEIAKEGSEGATADILASDCSRESHQSAQNNCIQRPEELKRVLVIVARFGVLAGAEACAPLHKITNLLPKTTSTRELR